MASGHRALTKPRADGLRHVGAQCLECGVAVVLEIVREIDGGHAALPELALDAVAVGERRTQTIERVRHRGSYGMGRAVRYRPAGGSARRGPDGQRDAGHARTGVSKLSLGRRAGLGLPPRLSGCPRGRTDKGAKVFVSEVGMPCDPAAGRVAHQACPRFAGTTPRPTSAGEHGTAVRARVFVRVGPVARAPRRFGSGATASIRPFLERIALGRPCEA